MIRRVTVESCQHRDTCAEVVKLRHDKARLEKICVAAQSDGFKHRCLPGGPAMVDDNCPMCDLEHEADLIATAAARIRKGRK